MPLAEIIRTSGTSQVVLVVKKPLANAEDVGLIPGLGRPLEEEMATHFSILAWEIPRSEEPGGLQSLVWQELDMMLLLNKCS